MKRNLFLDLFRGILCWVIVLVHIIWLSGGTQRDPGCHRAVGGASVHGDRRLRGGLLMAGGTVPPYLTKRLRIAPVWGVCAFSACRWEPPWCRHGLRPC
jgi:hypothetical protein